MTTDNRTPSRTLPEPFLAISLDGEGAHPAGGGGAASASGAKTGSWPCGERGVIEGPLTE